MSHSNVLTHPAGVLAIESAASNADTLPPAVCFEDATGCKLAFAALPVSRFGVVRVRILGAAQPAARVFLQSAAFNYVVASGVLQDELCWGCGSTFSPQLEAALVELVVAVGEDLEAAVQRMQPMMSLLAGAAQESDHMVVQMKKDVAAALENDNRKLAVGRLHQFLEQLHSSGGDISTLMSLPQTFKDAAAAFLSAKASCLSPSAFRLRMRAAIDAAIQLHRHALSTADASQQPAVASLGAFIAQASQLSRDSDAAASVTAAEADVAALLKPKLLGARLSSLMFMPVLSIDLLQATCSSFAFELRGH